MTYILIVALHWGLLTTPVANYSDPKLAVTMQEFSSKETCEAAAHLIARKDLMVVCVEK